MRDQIFSLIESLRQRIAVMQILMLYYNVIKDVGFLYKKTIAEINEVLY